MLVQDVLYFGVPSLEQKINLGVSFLIKSRVAISSGVSIWENNSSGY